MSSSDNTTMTASEESLLQYIGRYELTNFGSLIVVTLFYGIFITLFSMSIYITIRRGIRNFATWAVLIGTSINFAQQTVQWIMTLTWVIFYLQIFLVHNGQLSLEDRVALELKFGTHFLVPINELQPVPLLISDAFVIWRASVLFTRGRHSRAIAIPIICLVGTLAAFIALAVIPSDDGSAIYAASWALLALSITTNFLSTGMIGFRLWMYRKDVLPDLDGRKSPVHRIIITLVESGAVFCVLQVAFLIIQLATASDSSDNGPIMDSGIVMQQTVLSLAAIYPTFIILICRNHSSRIDEVASISMNVGTDLRFATVQASQSQSIGVSTTVNFATQSPHSFVCEAKADTSDIENKL